MTEYGTRINLKRSINMETATIRAAYMALDLLCLVVIFTYVNKLGPLYFGIKVTIYQGLIEHSN